MRIGPLYRPIIKDPVAARGVVAENSSSPPCLSVGTLGPWPVLVADLARDPL
jgi:hypothetical protein